MAWHTAVKTSAFWPVAIGLATLAFGTGGFGVWAATAPLKGAVIAPAKVTVTGNNKFVQHLEGGIVQNVFVREGQLVEAGQPLVELDGTAVTVQVNRLRLQLSTLRAMEARALAERNGAGEITFPEDAGVGLDAARLKADQESEFRLSLRKHRAELAVLTQQIAALKERITGHEIEKEQVARQVALLAEERQTVEDLFVDGLARKSQLMALHRSEAEMRGRQGRLIAETAEAKQTIAQIVERIDQAETSRAGEGSRQVNELRFRIAEASEQLRAAESIRTRTTVRAPVSGFVIGFVQRGIGSVLAPGETIMSIVPAGEGLVVEARVWPRDIEEVRLGQSAWMTFPAFDVRKMPPASAKVTYISADRVEDERTGISYYVARLEFTELQPDDFKPSLIRPGLDADVFISTGEKTFFEYVAAPIIRSFDRSLRES